MAQKFANAARGVLSTGIDDVTTTVTITEGGSLFPVANGTDWFRAVLQDQTGIEVVLVTGHTEGSNSFTVTRGQEGTTARSFAADSVFGLRVTAADMEDRVVGPTTSVANTVPVFSDTNGNVLGSSNAVIVSGPMLDELLDPIPNSEKTGLFVVPVAEDSTEQNAEAGSFAGTSFVLDSGLGTERGSNSSASNRSLRHYDPLSAEQNSTALSSTDSFINHAPTSNMAAATTSAESYTEVDALGKSKSRTSITSSAHRFVSGSTTEKADSELWSSAREGYMGTGLALTYYDPVDESHGIYIAAEDTADGHVIRSNGAPLDVAVDGTRVTSFTAFGEIGLGASRNPGTAGQVLTSGGAGQPVSWSNVSTDLAQGTRTTTTVPITSSTGTSATLSAATTSLAGVMSSADKTKLDGIATGANNYTHPANHPASIITQDSNNRFVTDAEKTSWNAKGDVTLTGTQTLANKTLTAPESTGAIYDNGSVRSNIVAVPALNIDCSAGNYFTKTINGNSTFTVSNVPASRAYAFTLELTHTSGTVTWFTGVQWPNQTAPTLTTGRTHLFVFCTDDGGTRWRGVANTNYTT